MVQVLPQCCLQACHEALSCASRPMGTLHCAPCRGASAEENGAVGHEGAAMLTASHLPRQWNGACPRPAPLLLSWYPLQVAAFLECPLPVAWRQADAPN